MANLKTNVKMEGAADVIDALRGVKFGVGNRVLVSALRKQVAITAKQAKAGVPKSERTGLLKKAIGYICRKPKRGMVGGGAFVIGARASVSGTVGAVPTRFQRLRSRITGAKARKSLKVTKKVLATFGGLVVKPWKYAHLVEGGHKAVAPKTKRVMASRGAVYGTQASGVLPKPFMKVAAVTLRSAGPAAIAADVKAGISREAAKYAAKGKSIYGATP